MGPTRTMARATRMVFPVVLSAVISEVVCGGSFRVSVGGIVTFLSRGNLMLGGCAARVSTNVSKVQHRADASCLLCVLIDHRTSRDCRRRRNNENTAKDERSAHPCCKDRDRDRKRWSSVVTKRGTSRGRKTAERLQDTLASPRYQFHETLTYQPVPSRPR